MIKLSGVLEQAMGKFYCLRGYAPIKDLERLSVKSESFQRDLITEHAGEMVKFLTERDGTFFPEVILSVNLANTEFSYDENDEIVAGNELGKSSYDQFAEEIKQIVTALTSKFELKKCNIGALTININFAKGTLNKNSTTDQGLSKKVLIGNLSIDETKFKNKFIRIDGNHRLTAAKDIDNIYNYYTPFCLVLFVNSEDQERFSTLFFHNINYQQIPITREHNLKIIINSSLYDDEYLDKEFGRNFLFARYILDEYFGVDITHYTEVYKFINGNRYTYFVELFELLFKKHPELMDCSQEKIVEFMKEQLGNVNSALLSCKNNAKNNIAVLGALTYYLLSDITKYGSFLNWFIKNDISSIEGLKITEVLAIYDKIYESVPKKVFLARWYPPKEEAKHHTKAELRLKEIDKIAKSLKLELKDLGSEIGGSFPIRSEMYESISESDIFIADLTGLSANVMVELGYALHFIGKKKVVIIHQTVDLKEKVPFDLSDFRYRQFSDTGEMYGLIKPDLEEIIRLSELGEI